MKKWISILFWLSCLAVTAQTSSSSPEDSLRGVIQESQGDSETSKIALATNVLAEFFRNDGNIDSAEFYYKISLNLSQQSGNQELTATNFYELGRISYQPKGKLDSALHYLQRALEIGKEINDNRRTADSYFFLGAVSSTKGNLSSALSNFQFSLPLYEKLNDSLGIADVYNSLGVVYSKREEFDKSLEFHRKAMAIQRTLDHLDGLAINYNNVGLTYKKKGDYPNALREFQLGLEIEKEIVFPVLRGALFNNIGNVFELQNILDSALFFQKESLEIAKEAGYNELIGWANKGIASIHLTNGNLAQAIVQGTTGYEIGVKTNTQDLSKQSAEVLHQAYSRKKDYQRAYLYHRLFKEHSDELVNAESIKNTAALEYEFQNEQSNRIQALELQAQEAIYLSQINEQKKIRNQILAGLILMASFLSVMWISYWQKRKVNKKLEEKNRIISDQAQNLEQLNETKDRFFSIISHDLRGPMAIFQGFSFMVKTMLEDKRYKKLEEFSDEVGKVSKRLSELLDNLLNWALKQQGQFPYHPEKLNLKECVDENLDIFNSMATSKKIELKCEVLSTSYVWADKNSLLTIFRNLINNAVKFTQPEGKIRIYCGQEEGFIAIKFSDTGVGVPEEKLESLFTFHEKKASVGTKGERGVGLGLQLVHDFVKLNLGEIRVESKPEEGTTFTVLLPPNPI